MKKIHKKHTGKLFTFFTALFMSLLMSGVVTLTNIGLNEHFIQLWMRGWGFAFLIGYPIISLVIPTVRVLITKITDQSN